jgi:hypothetical protein
MVKASSTTIKRGKEQSSKKKKKGIHFVNDQVSQAHIQKIPIEILTKWRQCQPKQDDGEPPRGSLVKLVREYQIHQSWLEDSSKAKMKWSNMKKVDKIRINNGLPLEEKKKSKKNNNNKQTNTKSPPSNSKPARYYCLEASASS